MLRQQDNKNYLNITNLIPKDSTVLDLACGCGNPFKSLKFPLLVGVDIFKKKFYMPEYDLVIFYDVRKITDLFLEKSFDVVIAIDAIEHLEKEEGFKLIEDAEKLARKKVIFFSPLIWSKNKAAVENPNYWSYGNPYNYHKSSWNSNDFTQRGYKIVPHPTRYVLAEKELK